jgi:hypothetical protein
MEEFVTLKDVCNYVSGFEVAKSMTQSTGDFKRQHFGTTRFRRHVENGLTFEDYFEKSNMERGF